MLYGMPSVRCEITRFISRDPQPDWVEAVLVDAEGKPWTFHDKSPIFTSENISPADQYPRDGWLRCTVVGFSESGDRVVIETLETDSLHGSSRFTVAADNVADP